MIKWLVCRVLGHDWRKPEMVNSPPDGKIEMCHRCGAGED